MPRTDRHTGGWCGAFLLSWVRASPGSVEVCRSLHPLPGEPLKLLRMRITWVIEGKGSGEAITADVDDAAGALATAVREAFDDLDSQTIAHIMLSVVAPLRVLLVTDGRQAVERGDEWQSQASPILVKLSPN